MNSLKIARTALRARPAALKAPLQRRGYADALSDKVGIRNSRLYTLLTSTDQIEPGPASSGM
jgi:F-type H+-transporting ATPase subunit delta